MKPGTMTLVFAALLAGCAARPLPDGSHIARLTPEQLAQAAPAISPEERERLHQLDLQVQDEQRRAEAEQERLRQLELARRDVEFYAAWGWGPGPWYRGGPYRWRGGAWWAWPY